MSEDNEVDEPFIGPIRRPWANWNVSLNVECPWCNEEFDLVEQWSSNCDWPDVNIPSSGDQIECACPWCNEEFECETTW